VRQRTTRPQTSAPDPAVTRTPSAHPILALQRTAGNRAVNALIARRRRRLDDEPELEPEGDVAGAQAALGAQAHTQGEQIHFAPGQLPEELLGHEAWHVRQQRQGRVG
jgi:hypothetical protein